MPPEKPSCTPLHVPVTEMGLGEGGFCFGMGDLHSTQVLYSSVLHLPLPVLSLPPCPVAAAVAVGITPEWGRKLDVLLNLSRVVHFCFVAFVCPTYQHAEVLLEGATMHDFFLAH